MPAVASEAAPRGTEVILLVLPDPASRTSTAFMLNRLGYTVLEAHHPAEALGIYEAHPGRVDLLISELRMPRGTGTELAGQLTGQDPGLRALFMADADLARRARRITGLKHLALLPCPFTIRLLAAAVRAALDRPARRPKTFTAGTPR